MLAVKKRGRVRRFCSQSCKAAAWRAGYLLRPCHYCGSPADTTDHVPPRHARAQLIAVGLADRFPFFEVDCCRECNGLLGARLWTIRARRRYIKWTLRRRYARLLLTPDWSDLELVKLGPTLRSAVLAGVIGARIIRARLAYVSGH